jgi:2-methylcitrate dehydratase PrpD
VHGQFNACYAFAQALEDGAVDIATFTKEHVRAHSPLATRLSCEISEEIEAEALAPAHLRLVLKDGSERVVNRPTMKGSPDDPMSDAEMTGKFAANLKWGWGLDRNEAEALAARIFALGEARDVRGLIDALSEASRL